MKTKKITIKINDEFDNYYEVGHKDVKEIQVDIGIQLWCRIVFKDSEKCYAGYPMEWEYFDTK